VLDEDEELNEKDPVVDGRGGSFSGVRPNAKGEDATCVCIPNGLLSASVLIPPKGLEVPEDDPNEKLEGVGLELLCPNKEADVVDGAELNENPLNEGRGSAALLG
jgi:hypothetical protein